MDLTNCTTVIPIVVICYLAGLYCKANKKIADKYIPIIVGVVGGLIGIPAMYIMADYPASDVITAIAVGIMSGLASTGVDQIRKQIKKEE